jgi:trimethylamine---corrinoid protein Co-methyltransferase
MSVHSLHLPPLLSPGQCQRIHEEALGLIERVGTQVRNANLRELLTGKAGIHFRDGRARIERTLVEEMVAEHRHRLAHQAPPMTNQGQAPKDAGQIDGIYMTAGTHARWWHDADTNEVRPSVLKDQVMAAKLIYGLRDQRVTGSTSGAATDLPEPLQSVTQTYVALRYAGRPIYSSIGSIEEMGIILDLFEAAGKPCEMPMHLISPLRFEGQELDIILAHRDRLSGVHLSNMPICGASAPVFLPGGLVVSAAEVLAGYTLMRLLFPEMNLSFSLGLFCMDFKRGGMVYGTPEHNLVDLARIAMNRHYGVPVVGSRSIRSMAKRPGPQASAEKAASAVVGALAGSKVFYGGGLLSLDELFSPIQLVIDCEIRDYAQRLAAGFEFSDETLAVRVIEDALKEDGNFLLQDQTLTQYQRMYWMPRMFDYGMMGGHLAGETKDAVEAARARMDQVIRRYDFALPEDVRRKVDAVYGRQCDRYGLKLQDLLPG